MNQALAGIDQLLGAVSEAADAVPDPVSEPPVAVEPPPPATPPVPPDPTPPPAAPPAPAPSIASPPPVEAASPASSDGDPDDPRRLVRARLLDIHGAMLELNRLLEPEAILKRLWDFSRERHLRCMLLSTKGRALQAERAEGFAGLDGASPQRIQKITVPFDKDGVFAAVADERSVYSGPRPARGMPVDLVLVLGKQTPVWSLIIPFPYRNRWGRFLLVETDVEGMEGIFQLDAVARFAVMQMHAARFHRHAPADKTRAIKTFTLQERQRRRQARVEAKAKAKPETPPPTPEAPPEPDTTENAELMAMLANKGRKPGDRPSLIQAPAAVEETDDASPAPLLEPDDILARIGDLPAMPHVALKVLGMLNDPETTVQAIQEAISSDQALSVRLLQIANSSLYGTMRDCSTISEAVMRLGFKSIRSWLLATATRTAFVQGGSSTDLELLWRQSIAAAMAAQMLAEESGQMDPEVAFMGGLLQNLGLLLVARDHPAVFSEILHHSRQSRRPLHEVERSMMGFDHADLSALILQHWGLSDDLVAAVGAHHRLESAGSSRTFAAVVELAERLAMRTSHEAGYLDALSGDLDAARILGLDGPTLDELEERLEATVNDRRLIP